MIRDIELSVFVEHIAKIRMLLGVPKDYSNKEELIVAARFVHSQFGHLTEKELDLAFMLFIMNSYDVDIQFYGMLSPLFISQVLNAYIYYRKTKLTEAIREKEKYEEKIMLEKNKPTKEQMADSMKHIIVDFWNDWKQKGEFSDILSISYNFFRKHKDLFAFKFDERRINDANEWAEKKMVKSRQSGGFFKFNDDDELKQKNKFARVWCVMDYFSRFQTVEQITNKITPDLW